MGLFDGAGVDVAKISDDPFNFGREFWPIGVEQVAEPKLSKNGSGKFGCMVYYSIQHPRFANRKPFGKWLQLPTPLVLQEQTGIYFNIEENPDDMEVMFNLKTLFLHMGFRMDEMNSINPEVHLVGRMLLAKLFARQNDEGFWQVNFNTTKPIPADGISGLSVFAAGNNSAPAEDDVEEAMRKAASGE